MRYRKLGGTDLDVSVICMGPMRAAAKAQELWRPKVRFQDVRTVPGSGFGPG